nr:putative uncharacterized protein C10orf113 homolog [Cavia porcellus]
MLEWASSREPVAEGAHRGRGTFRAGTATVLMVEAARNPLAVEGLHHEVPGRFGPRDGLRPPRELSGMTRRLQSWPRLARWLQRQPQSLQAGNWSLSLLAAPGTGPGGWAKSPRLSLGPEGVTRGRRRFQFQGIKFSTSKKELKMTSWNV